MNEEKYLVSVAAYVPFGPARLGLLRKYFKSSENIWKANSKELLQTGLSHNLVSGFVDHRKNFDIDAYFEKLEKLGVRTISIDDENYPRNLKDIESAPVVLYVKGELNKKDETAIAIIGSRKMTSYGSEVAYTFARDLATVGVTIVSGLAMGIDARGHLGALDAGGRTIAVLGCGLDTIYPASNKHLAEKIINTESGALISEYPFGYPSLPVNFVSRNRIVSGLSKAIVVVEGRQKSGTLLTAKHAAEQAREVFAIPGQINSPTSEAPFYLIRNGAKMAITPNDIIEELNLQLSVDKEKMEKVMPGDELEKKIVEFLEIEGKEIDEIVRHLNLSGGEVLAKLSVMELKGMVRRIDDTYGLV